FKTTDGTARTSDQDYVAKSGALIFAPGETTKTITITVIGDSKKETDEMFFVDLFGNSSNSLFDKNRGIGGILYDELAVLHLEAHLPPARCERSARAVCSVPCPMSRASFRPLSRAIRTPPSSCCRWSMASCAGWRRRSWLRRSRGRRCSQQRSCMKRICASSM